MTYLLTMHTIASRSAWLVRRKDRKAGNSFKAMYNIHLGTSLDFEQ